MSLKHFTPFNFPVVQSFKLKEVTVKTCPENGNHVELTFEILAMERKYEVTKKFTYSEFFGEAKEIGKID